MKDKGFTLMELLAVIVILAILVVIATISVTRYRNKVDVFDKEDLHSTIETAYNNYRTDETSKGNTIKNVTVSEVNDPFDKYIKGISYNGQKLNKNKLDISIELHSKGDVLYKNEYRDYVNERVGKTKIKKSSGTENATAQDIYVIDATCEVTHTSDTTGGSIDKTCVGGETKPEPSKEDLVCIKVTYDNNVIFDDFDSNTTINKLCDFVR